MRYIRSGVERNATLECGGHQIGNKGYFIQPTVFSNVKVTEKKKEAFQCCFITSNYVIKR